MSRIDFHAHILPRVDHGSDSLSTSLFQLAQAAAVGINTIVATPHFYPDRHHPSDFLLCRQKAFQELRQAYHGDITILPAAEVLLCEGLAHLPELDQLCIPGTKVLLLEMPMGSWSRRQLEALFQLRDEAGLTVVLAHVDRYFPKQVESLLAQGFLGQINAGSICHFISGRRLFAWVKQYNIVALGSDIHGQSKAYCHFRRACFLLGREIDPLMSRTKHLLATKPV